MRARFPSLILVLLLLLQYQCASVRFATALGLRLGFVLFLLFFSTVRWAYYRRASTVGKITVGSSLLGQVPVGQDEAQRKRQGGWEGALVGLAEEVGCVCCSVYLYLLCHSSRRVFGAVVAVVDFTGIITQYYSWWTVIELLRKVGGPGDHGPS